MHMTGPESENVLKQNLYLKSRCAQLEDDVTNLSAEVLRLRQQLEGAYARRVAGPPNPLSGGQS